MLIGILKWTQDSIKAMKISMCGEVDNHVLKMFKSYKV